MADFQDAAFIENVVKQLVENPDAVKVERSVDEMGVLIQLIVDQADMGRVIGKEGRTAKALRTLLRVIGAKNNARVNLKIMEPDGSEVRIDSGDGGSDETPKTKRRNDDAEASPVPAETSGTESVGEPAAESVTEDAPVATDEQPVEELPVAEETPTEAPVDRGGDEQKDDEQATAVL